MQSCVLLYVPFDGGRGLLSSFQRALALKQLELGFVCSSYTEGGGDGGAQQWEGTHTLLYTLSTAHIPFSVPHLTWKACVM